MKLINEKLNLLAQTVILIGSFYAVIQFFDPIGEKEISYYVSQQIPIVTVADSAYSNIPELELSVKYRNQQINNAVFLELIFKNTGKEPLGNAYPKTVEWLPVKFFIDSGILIAPISLNKYPPNLEVKVGESSTLADSIIVKLGLLNPNDSIKLGIIVLDAGPDQIGDIQLLTRISGMRAPIRSALSRHDRVRKAYLIPLFVLFSFLGAYLAIKWTWKELFLNLPDKKFGKVFKVAGRLYMGISAVAVGSLFASGAFAYAISKLFF